MMKTNFTYKLYFILGCSLVFAMPLMGQSSVTYGENDIAIDYDPTYSTGTIFDLGTLTVEDTVTTTHWGYDLLLEGTEDLTSITGIINATVGPSSGSVSWNSWELLRLDNAPSVDVVYDWVLDVDMTITSAANPTGDANLYSDTTYGILLHYFNAGGAGYNIIKQVDGSVTVIDYIGLESGSGTPAESTDAVVYGVELGAYFSVETLSTTVNVIDSSSAVGYQFNNGTRVGIDSDGNMIQGAGITGTINMHNVVQAVGIQLKGIGDFNTGSQQPEIGYNDAQISISSDADIAVDAAVGIFVDGEGTANDVTGTLSGIFTGNIDVDVVLNPDVLSSSVNPPVIGIQIIQDPANFDENTDGRVVFGDGANVSAQYILSGETEKQLGDAINYVAAGNELALELSTENSTDTVTLVGNLRSQYTSGTTRFAQDVIFEQGNFVMTSDVFELSSITLGSIDAAEQIMTHASLTLEQSLEVDGATDVDFYVQGEGMGNYSSITLNNGGTLTLDGTENINLYLSTDLLTAGQFDIDLISGLIEGFDSNSTVNIYGTDLSGGTNSLLWSFGMSDAYDSYLSQDVTTGFFQVTHDAGGLNIRAYTTLIPEPSTATLSLLALAALLMRPRRR